MKFYVLDKDGNLVPATPEDIADAEIQKYVLDDGKMVKVSQAVVTASAAPEDSQDKAPEKAPAVHVDLSPVKELTGLVNELAEQIKGDKDVKTRTEELEAELAKHREAAGKGLVVPPPQDGDEGPKTPKGIYAGWNLDVQGRAFTNHPIHKMSEELREKLAKFWCLSIKGGVFNSPDAAREFQSEFKTGSVEIGDTGNVFPIPEPLMVEILHYARESSVVLQEARTFPMTSTKMSWPLETSGVAVDWGNETVESDPTISEVELECYELSAYSKVKRVQLMDAQSDIVSWLTELMVNAIGQELDNVAFNGDGSDAGCSGILSAECGYSVVMGSGSTSFADLDGDVLSEMIAKLDGVRKQGAKFYLNGSILHYVRTLKDSNDRPIFQQQVGQMVPGMIWGFPYREVVKCPATDAANTAFIAYGNMKHFFIGRRHGDQALEVNPYLDWANNRVAFKIYNRWALKMALPNGFVRLLTAT